MNILSSVSETALITLKSRVAEAEKPNPIINDKVGIALLTRIESALPDEVRERMMSGKVPGSLSCHVALRALKYDECAREFLESNPGGVVVSLGSGFDTRFWRINADPERYIEVDLAPVIETKRELLGDAVPFRMIAGSVLENGWLEEVLKIQDRSILFLAEGLFMYLKPVDVKDTFKRISAAVSGSSIVFEVVNEKYTRGVWKKMVISKMKKNTGSPAGASFDFGVRDAREVEAFGEGIKVTGEWSYFEDQRIKPAILKLFRGWRFMTRTQWTVMAEIE